MNGWAFPSIWTLSAFHWGVLRTRLGRLREKTKNTFETFCILFLYDCNSMEDGAVALLENNGGLGIRTIREAVSHLKVCQVHTHDGLLEAK